MNARTWIVSAVLLAFPALHAAGAGCDINTDGLTNVSDVQLCANQAIGVTACATGDIDGNGQCNVIDVQRVVNAALGGTCVSTTPPPPPPPSAGTWPSGWNDPIFANVTARAVNSYGMSGVNQDFSIDTNSGEPAIGCQNFTARRFRIRGREGVRICGDNVLLEDFYLDISGSGTDHADAIQAYGGQGDTNIVFRRGLIEINQPAANTGVFMADFSNVDLTMEDVKVVAGPGVPNGAVFIANVGSDHGCHSLTFRNVIIAGGYRFENLNSANGCNIIEWTNVRDGNGTPIPRPQ